MICIHMYVYIYIYMLNTCSENKGLHIYPSVQQNKKRWLRSPKSAYHRTSHLHRTRLFSAYFAKQFPGSTTSSDSPRLRLGTVSGHKRGTGLLESCGAPKLGPLETHLVMDLWLYNDMSATNFRNPSYSSQPIPFNLATATIYPIFCQVASETSPGGMPMAAGSNHSMKM